MSVQTIRPESEIAVGVWTVVGAPFHHEALMEDVSDGDTSYCAVATASALICEMQNHGIPDDGILSSIDFYAVARHLIGAGATPIIDLILRYGTTDYVMAFWDTTHSFASYSVTTTVHPATGQPWTPANAQGLRFGVGYEIQALPRPQMRVTQLYATLNHTIPTWTQSSVPPIY